jgi:hypothetical protein
MRGITWETGGTMNTTRPMYAYACPIRLSLEFNWIQTARAVLSLTCLDVAAEQGLS